MLKEQQLPTETPELTTDSIIQQGQEITPLKSEILRDIFFPILNNVDYIYLDLEEFLH